MFYKGAGSSWEETAISLEETATSWGQTMACQSSSVETVVCEKSLWTGEGCAFPPQFEVWGRLFRLGGGGAPHSLFIKMYGRGWKLWGAVSEVTVPL